MATSSATAREKAKIQNSLICLIQSLCGEIVTVELRNESYVTGVLDHVDMWMNLTMSNVDFTYTNGSVATFDNFYVKGQNVRYIPIPSHIDMVKAVESQLKGYQGRTKSKRTENWIKKQKQKAHVKRKEEDMIRRLQQREASRADKAREATKSKNTREFSKSSNVRDTSKSSNVCAVRK